MPAIKDDAWFQQTRKRIIANREWQVRGLSELGFEVLVANFVFARHRCRGGACLVDQLRELGVLVRPRIEDFLRITIGTEDQCSRLIALARIWFDPVLHPAEQHMLRSILHFAAARPLKLPPRSPQS